MKILSGIRKKLGSKIVTRFLLLEGIKTVKKGQNDTEKYVYIQILSFEIHRVCFFKI